MEMLNQKQKIIVIVIAIIVIGIVGVYYINSTKEIYSNEEIDYEVVEINENEKSERNIIVHIAGAVKRNGIVEVKENSRINDIVEAAGGLTDNADLNQVNLAYIVEDGQKIYIPSIDEYKEKTEEIIQENAGNNVTEETRESTILININKANLQELCMLPGIGEATAQKIIQYREENSKFSSIEEIKNVSGIGEAKYESIKDFIEI